MPEQDAEPGFTVVDRRRRGPDAEGAEAPREPIRETRRPSPPPPPSRGAPPGAGQPAGASGTAPRADFGSFCVMLYSDALAQLGQVPDPMTGQPQVDLEQARFTIDLLGMLKEKSEGNRTPQESAVLEEILANLQLAFVRQTRRA